MPAEFKLSGNRSCGAGQLATHSSTNHRRECRVVLVQTSTFILADHPSAMKLLIISNMYPSDEKPYGGIFVRNQVEVLQELYGAQLDISVRAMQRRYTGKLGSFLKYAKFGLQCVPMFFRHFDIVHVHYFVPTGILGWIYRFAHRKSKFVVTFHGGDLNPILFRGHRALLWRRVSRSIDLAIGVGPAVVQRINDSLRPRRVILQPAGIDSRRFFPPGVETSSKQFDFVFAGSFNERKGLDLLLTALEDPDFSDVRVAFVGTGPMRDRIRELSNRRPFAIRDYLTQDELRIVLWASKFLVLPSRTEPFGLVVSEANFCGVPAIVSNEPGLTLQISDYHNGLVFENGSLANLKSTLRIAINMDIANYGRMAAAASKSNRRFDIFEVASELMAEYRRTLTPEGDY
jgi:glycosyltransferase involved in cell wall biosynthesis